MAKTDNCFALFLLGLFTFPIWGLFLMAALSSPKSPASMSEAEKNREREATLQAWIDTMDDSHPRWSEGDKLYAAAFRAKQDLSKRGIDPGPGFAALDALTR